MNNTITVKTDAATKKAAESLAKDAGLSLEGLIIACINQAIISRHLDIYQPMPVSPKLEKILEEARQEIAQGDFIGPFDNYEETVEALDKTLEDDELAITGPR